MRSLHEGILMVEATIFVLLLVALQVQRIYTAEIIVISESRFLTEGDTLVSPTGVFELGFFRPESSDNKYVGIWYKKISVKTVVWLANGDLPVTAATSGTLKIVSPGNLVLMNDANDMLWSSNTTSSGNATVQLEDTGNLVVREVIGEKILWQSFDYPTDTLLPGMKVGRNFLTGKEWHLSSWKSSRDPAPGEFTWSVDTRGYAQYLLKQGTSVKYRSGPWNGLTFSGGSIRSKSGIVTTNMVNNESEVAYSYNLVNSSLVSRLALNSSGQLEWSSWEEDAKIWQVVFQLPRDICDKYNTCKSYGTCSTLNSPMCACLDKKRFLPRDQQGWQRRDWVGGCVRRRQLDCKTGSDGFIKYSNVKLPDTQTSWFNMSMRGKECKAKCLKNCTCMAYANTDIRSKGSGCLLWFNELWDIRVYSDSNRGQDIFVRMASSELEWKSQNQNYRTCYFSGGSSDRRELYMVLVFMEKRHHAQPPREGEVLHVGESQRDGMELPLFSFSTIAKATGNFSADNIIGEGGFGAVYKVTVVSIDSHKILSGYMSPEYALDGVFSIKSDAFSFGVLVLEIVIGKRNRGFIHPEHDNNLIGHAWRMHDEGRSMELIDTTLRQSSNSLEVIRSITVGLLCVQQCPKDRPNMSSVVLMLGNEGALLKPKQPAFFTEKSILGADFTSSSYPTSSTNDITITEVVAR
ncbi:hypothetical protein L1887_25451 [Cichorium endivia]|nr:hypothetical protein L1887_25451 [Cichorium endivia]